MSAWTTTRPTAAGWYWLRDGSAEVVVQIEIGITDSFHVEWVWFAGSRSHVPLAAIDGEWQPVQGPVDIQLT